MLLREHRILTLTVSILTMLRIRQDIKIENHKSNIPAPSDALTLRRPPSLSLSAPGPGLGASTGMFTLALRQLLESGTIYAVDKNPHVLWSLAGGSPVEAVVARGRLHPPAGTAVAGRDRDGTPRNNSLSCQTSP